MDRAIFRPTPWKPGIRNDIIHVDPDKHSEAFNSLKIDNSGAGNVLPVIKQILQSYWDSFTKEGIKRVILGFEYSIDTGAAPPVYCRKSHYGPHEYVIINTQIKVLWGNDWIEHYRSGWESPIVLAPKPHQESVVDIDKFIWRMCVSYHGLNKVTNPFEYPIGRCDSAIEDLGDASGIIFFICLDKA